MTAFQNLNRMRQCQLSSARSLAQHLLASAKMDRASSVASMRLYSPGLPHNLLAPKALGAKPQLRVPYGDWFVGFREISSADALDWIEASVRPILIPMTRVGVLPFARVSSCLTC